MTFTPLFIYMSFKLQPLIVSCLPHLLIFFVSFLTPSSHPVSIMTSKICEFLGDMVLTRFFRFYASKKDEAVVVIACCIEVDEGVDMWFPEECNGFDPRLHILFYFCVVGLLVFICVLSWYRCECSPYPHLFFVICLGSS